MPDYIIPDHIKNNPLFAYRFDEFDRNWSQCTDTHGISAYKINKALQGQLLGILPFIHESELVRLPYFGRKSAFELKLLCPAVFDVPLGHYSPSRDSYDSRWLMLERPAEKDNLDVWFAYQQARENAQDIDPLIAKERFMQLAAKVVRPSSTYEIKPIVFSIPLRDIYRAAISDRSVPDVTKENLAVEIKKDLSVALAGEASTGSAASIAQTTSVQQTLKVAVAKTPKGLTVSVLTPQGSPYVSELRKAFRRGTKNTSQVRRVVETKIRQFIADKIKASLA